VPQLPNPDYRPSDIGGEAVPHKGHSVYTGSGAQHDVQSAIGGFLMEYSSSTAAAYTRDLACFQRWCGFHDLEPLTCRRPNIAAYLQSLRSAGYAESTIGRRLACLRAFYRYTVEEEIVDRSPAAAVRWRQSQPARRTGLDAAELSRLLRAADGHSPRVAAAVWLLATTGARISEVCNADASTNGLRRSDPSWLLRIVRKGGALAWLPLHPAAVDRLTAYPQGRTAGPLLQTATGKAWDRRAAHRTLSGLGRGLGLDRPLGPHTLRHTLVTLARTHGCPLETIQDAVGHANPSTTRRYDHTDPAAFAQPAEYLLAGLPSGNPS